MRVLVLLLPVALGGCVVETVAKTAVDVVTLPVKVASAGVDAMTTSQKEADEKRGREARKQDEVRGKQMRLAMERCRQGKASPDRQLRGAPAPLGGLDALFPGHGI